jgi:hypothetical protein
MYQMLLWRRKSILDNSVGLCTVQVKNMISLCACVAMAVADVTCAIRTLQLFRLTLIHSIPDVQIEHASHHVGRAIHSHA